MQLKRDRAEPSGAESKKNAVQSGQAKSWNMRLAQVTGRSVGRRRDESFVASQSASQSNIVMKIFFFYNNKKTNTWHRIKETESEKISIQLAAVAVAKLLEEKVCI